MPPKTPEIPPSFDADAVARLLLGEAIEDRLRNRIPVLEPGPIPGSSVISGFRDRRDPTPEGQPSEQRLDAELQFLSRNADFAPQIGKRLESFNIVDPFESEGPFDSITNIGRQAYTQSLTGDIEVGLEKLLGVGNQLPDAFGFIDLNRAQAFRPNLAEQIGSGVASFFMPLDLAALWAGGGIGSKGLRLLASQVVKNPRSSAGLIRLAQKAVSPGVIPETLSLAERVVPRSIKASVQLGTYEGSRGFFEGFNNGENPLEYFYKGAGRGAILGAGIGLAAGAIPWAIGAKSLSETTRKALAGTSRASAEIFTLGTLSPFTEGRTPTSEDYINAAGFILGIKTVGGFSSIPRRVFNRRLMAEARRLEKAKDIVAEFNRSPERIIAKNDLYDAKFWEKVRSAEDGTEVGKVGDFLKDKDVRKAFEDILDARIKVSSEVPEGYLREGQKQTGRVGFDEVDGLFKIFLDPTSPAEMAVSMFHEMAHLMRRAKGRKLGTGEQVQVKDGKILRGEQIEEGAETVEFSEALAEGFAERLAVGIKPRGPSIRRPQVQKKRTFLQRAAKDVVSQRVFERALEKKKSITVSAKDGKLPEKGIGPQTRREINRLLPKGDKRPTRFTITPNSVVAEFKPGKRNTLLVLDVKGKEAKNKIDILNKIVEQAGNKPVYITQRLAKQSAFKEFVEADVFKKVGKFFRVTEPIAGEVIRRDVVGVELKKLVPKPIDPKSLTDRQVDVMAKRNKEIGEPPAFRILPQKARDLTEAISRRSWVPRLVKQVKNRWPKIPEYKAVIALVQVAENLTAFLRGGFLSRAMTAGLHRLNPTILEKAAGLLPKRFGIKDKFLDEAIQMTRDLMNGKINTADMRALRQILNEIIAEAEKASGRKFGFIKNYVPNIMNLEVRQKITSELLTLEREIVERFPNLGDPTKFGRVKLNAKIVGGKDVVDQTISKLLVSKSRELREVLTFVEGKGGLRSKANAIRFTRDYLTEEAFAEPSYLKKRKLPNWPEHLREMDIRVWLPDYISSMTKFIGRQRTFGRKAEKLNKLMLDVGAKSFEAEKDLARAISMWDGSYELERGLRGNAKTLIDWFTGFQVGTKIGMGGATLLNLSQPMISIIPALGAFNFIRGTFSLLDPAVRLRVRKTGVTDYMTTKAMEAVAGHRPGGFMGRFADFTTTVSGFQGINKALLYMSAATMEIAIKGWHRQAATGGLRAKFAQRKLKEFGVDQNKDLRSQEEAMFKAMYRFGTDSQLQRNIFNEPFFFNEPFVRPLTLFKRFGVRQFNFARELIWNETFRKGNIMPTLRLAAGGYLGGAGVVWALNTIKGILSGEDVPDQHDSLTDEIISRISRVGAIGFMSDFMEIGSDIGNFRRTVEFAVLPVAVSDLQTVMGATQRFLNDYKRYGEGFLAIRRNAYSLAGILGTYPRALSKQLLTEPQITSRREFRKSREKTRIFELLLEGKAKRAGDGVAEWNDANPENPIRIDEVDSTAFKNWVKRKARAFATAKALKDTPAFRRIERQKFGEILAQSRRTRNVSEFRRAVNQ